MTERFVPVHPLDIEKDQVIMGNEEENVKFKTSIKEVKENFKSKLSLQSSEYEILKEYLESIFKKSFHKKPEIYGRLSLPEHLYSYAKRTCINLGFVKENKITEKGIEFLKYLQQREILEKQNKINWWLVAFTSILAISTIFQIAI